MRTSSVTCRPAAASTWVRDLLAGPPRAATVLAVFPAAAYVRVTDADRVVAVVTRDAVRLPCALVVTAASTARPWAAVRPGDPVEVGEGVVRLGPLAVAAARRWDPVPRLPRVEPVVLSARRTALAERLARARVRPGLPLASEPLEDDGAAGDLARAAVADDTGAGERAVARLLGRGPGLTPSGDDVVAGLLATLRLLGKGGTAAYADDLGAAVTLRARRATTPVSAELLRAAARGAVAAPAAAVLRALTGHADLPSAVAGLLRIGATSGADLAWGLLAGATVALRVRRDFGDDAEHNSGEAA